MMRMAQRVTVMLAPCMRVKKSGKRSKPRPPITPDRLPLISRMAPMSSFMASAPTLLGRDVGFVAVELEPGDHADVVDQGVHQGDVEEIPVAAEEIDHADE